MVEKASLPTVPSWQTDSRNANSWVFIAKMKIIPSKGKKAVRNKMKNHRRKCGRLKRPEPAPLHETMEDSFPENDALESCHPLARGTTFGGIRKAAARANGSTMPQGDENAGSALATKRTAFMRISPV
ncbi:MAG: hypothetical protein LV479_11250 [Methylacidiphilales bacterium]|nr:hypothetical protein [Candidatus Methylacidiphilales bacterium]